MLALVLAMLVCVALGAGVVGYVMVEARREGRGGFWTPEGEELIAGARRTGERVRTRGEQLGRSAGRRTHPAGERGADAEMAPGGEYPADEVPERAPDSAHEVPTAGGAAGEDHDGKQFRAAS